MVTKRKHNPNDSADIAKFIEAAKPTPEKLVRDRKLLVAFNQKEYDELERLSKKTGRTRTNALRWAISEALKSLT